MLTRGRGNYVRFECKFGARAVVGIARNGNLAIRRTSASAGGIFICVNRVEGVVNVLATYVAFCLFMNLLRGLFCLKGECFFIRAGSCCLFLNDL